MANFRHEWKHEINTSDAAVVRQRLMTVTKPDPHAQMICLPDISGRPGIHRYIYEIRSLYFDNLTDKALREKIDGVNMREKFRIRYYNGDASVIHLEKKRKCNGLTSKESALLTKEDVQKILCGDYGFMAHSPYALVVELYHKMRTEGLAPKTIVDYTREPFVYAPGNVRVTLDYNIRTGIGWTDFLNPDCVTISAGDQIMIMEVKWDAFLPDIIRDAVQLTGRRAGAFSKYAACRIYG
ncbi:polyphosphate polymerase domain-containing protein [Parablautia muri]|uniref:Polyphosphate polymerase domain-containing protein n=1 Tax=Parablautia muri TaxID=2320879 RepID=A0A9X5BER8_9FIRM|nr:polyphosphate polymerase domain-containing protein [Parablautia muri]NBJ92466.1 polyphosphate polymerase domain-containing protein [Parablautia muri]